MEAGAGAGAEAEAELAWSRETIPRVAKIVCARLPQRDLVALLLASPWLHRTLASYPSLWLVSPPSPDEVLPLSFLGNRADLGRFGDVMRVRFRFLICGRWPVRGIGSWTLFPWLVRESGRWNVRVFEWIVGVVREALFGAAWFDDVWFWLSQCLGCCSWSTHCADEIIRGFGSRDIARWSELTWNSPKISRTNTWSPSRARYHRVVCIVLLLIEIRLLATGRWRELRIVASLIFWGQMLSFEGLHEISRKCLLLDPSVAISNLVLLCSDTNQKDMPCCFNTHIRGPSQ